MLITGGIGKKKTKNFLFFLPYPIDDIII